TILATLVTSVAANADIAFSISDVTLDPVNGNYQGTEFQHGVNAWTFDILINVTADDDWTLGCLKGVTSLGSSWYYSDPNVAPAPPGSADSPQRFSTFVSLPQTQFGSARFPSLDSFAIVGSYLPASQTPIANAGEVNVVWLELPPQTTTAD